MLGAGQVISLDIDPDALDIAQSNCEDFDVESTVDFVMCNLNQSASSLLKYLKERRVVDTVVMNPPFGTKMNKGELDLLLIRALRYYIMLFRYYIIYNVIEDILPGIWFKIKKRMTRSFIHFMFYSFRFKLNISSYMLRY